LRLTTKLTQTLFPNFRIVGGGPFGYFDWAMIVQLILNGIESAAMFQAAASVVDFATEKGFLSRFPG